MGAVACLQMCRPRVGSLCAAAVERESRILVLAGQSYCLASGSAGTLVLRQQVRRRAGLLQRRCPRSCGWSDRPLSGGWTDAGSTVHARWDQLSSELAWKQAPMRSRSHAHRIRTPWPDGHSDRRARERGPLTAGERSCLSLPCLLNAPVCRAHLIP